MLAGVEARVANEGVGFFGPELDDAGRQQFDALDAGRHVPVRHQPNLLCNLVFANGEASFYSGGSAFAPSIACRTNGIGGPPNDKNWSWKSCHADGPPRLAVQSARSFRIMSLPSR